VELIVTGVLDPTEEEAPFRAPVEVTVPPETVPVVVIEAPVIVPPELILVATARPPSRITQPVEVFVLAVIF
jgi:hypothetical protein